MVVPVLNKRQWCSRKQLEVVTGLAQFLASSRQPGVERGLKGGRGSRRQVGVRMQASFSAWQRFIQWEVIRDVEQDGGVWPDVGFVKKWWVGAYGIKTEENWYICQLSWNWVSTTNFSFFLVEYRQRKTRLWACVFFVWFFFVFFF